MNWAARKLASWRLSLDALKGEVAFWLGRAQDAKDVFTRHRSQILRLATYLDSACAALEARLQTLEKHPDTALAEGTLLDSRLTGLYRVWESFRGYLAQRDVARFRPTLRAADDLAWHCYDAARQAADPAVVPPSSVKEPPLVYLDGDFSPFARERGRRFLARQLASDGLLEESLLRVLDALPVPLIGIPWRQVCHPPDALVVAHETGHLVEDDFGLGDSLDLRLEEAMAGRVDTIRQGAWRSWRREVFADLFATLAAGPAYLQALAGYLATDPTDIAAETRNPLLWLAYPTVSLRILLGATVLRALDFEVEAGEIQTAWRQTYDPHQLQPFEEDLEIVAAALLEGPYPAFGNRRLDEVIRFQPGAQKIAASNGRNALKKVSPGSNAAFDLVIAAQLAFAEDPDQFRRNGVGPWLLEKIPQQTAFRSKQIAERNLDAELAHDAQSGTAFESCFD